MFLFLPLSRVSQLIYHNLQTPETVSTDGESVVELQGNGKRERHQLILPYLEFLISSQTRELPKLQLNAGHLCHSAVRCPARGMCSAPTNVDIRIWYLGGSLECWHKPVSNVFLKKTQEHRAKQQTKQK